MESTLNNIPLIYLFCTLFVLLLLSAFFSGSETGMMSINRYRLKHLAKTNKVAKRTSSLIAKPEKLLAVILICNNFVNISASALVTIIGAKLFGDVGILLATAVLTIVIIIFGEITPKTLAAAHPDKVSFYASMPLKILMTLLHPIVILTNVLSKAVLRVFGIKLHASHHKKKDELSLDELRTVLTEATAMIHTKHKEMLTSIVNLETITVNDIMIPRLDVYGIDLEDDEETIINQLKSTQHTLLPMYRRDLNKVEGIIHMRSISSIITQQEFSVQKISELMVKPYFVPEGTSLYQQLINFQRNKFRIAMVVDEYGDVQGIITLADILEEIVGEFTTDITDIEQEIHPQSDGTTLVDGSIYIRDLNKSMKWKIPTNQAKTLSGIIIEHLESIPEAGTCLKLQEYKLEVVQVQDNMIKTVKFYK